MSDVSLSTNPLPAEENVEQSAGLDKQCDCFEPYIAPELPPVPPKPKPPRKQPESVMGDVIDEINAARRRRLGLNVPETPEIQNEVESKVEDEVKEDPKPTAVDSPPPRFATAAELITWIKAALLGLTVLSDDEAELLAFWVISTWFKERMRILPCIVLTGGAHDARQVLWVLSWFCRLPVLTEVRGNPGALEQCGACTALILAPRLNQRTADLLSNLTDANFRVTYGGGLPTCGLPMAIYAGENPQVPRIQNSVHIHIPLTKIQSRTPGNYLGDIVAHLETHLKQYRERHVYGVKDGKFRVLLRPISEVEAMVTELGRCIIDAPKLLVRLSTLLKTRDSDRLAELSNTNEAVLLEAVQVFVHENREQVFTHEIAAQANHQFEARLETTRLNPEKVGHMLKKLGLHTHRLSQAGNGLTFDKATLAQLQLLVSTYLVEDASTGSENLPRPDATEK